uniref:Uncharacterized protein n=1 Tax=Rhizophora mucronata TaxID=61149 RepID=A0A2P2P185_RHIMU
MFIKLFSQFFYSLLCCYSILRTWKYVKLV